MIREKGTPEQVEQLEKLLGTTTNPNTGISKEGLEYLERLRNTPPTSEKKHRMVAAQYLVNKLKVNKGLKPNGITLDISKKIFWDYYRELVFQETQIEIKRVDDHMSKAMNNFVHWLIGSESGEFNPNKSLYIFGDLGVGKSTLVMAGHYMLDFFRSSYNWDKRFYKFVSMDELFLETYSTQSLEKIGLLGKGCWCLDELREKHVSYKHYGNDIMILADILTARHNIWKRDGTNTLITTNIPPKRFEDLLMDERLYDRVKQQYQVVEIKGGNKRHPKYRL